MKTGAGGLTINNTGVSAFTGGTTINGGTLSLFNAGTSLPGAGVLPKALIVNITGTLYASPRGGFSGSVSGSGVLTYYTPFIRADVTGD